MTERCAMTIARKHGQFAKQNGSIGSTIFVNGDVTVTPFYLGIIIVLVILKCKCL